MRTDSKIFVAGGRGLVGSAIIRALGAAGYRDVIAPPRSELDLEDQRVVATFFNQEKPKYVFLAAAKVGGILANSTYPADFLRTNLAIQLNVIDSAYRAGVTKLLMLGSSCIYPRLAHQPISESELLTGPLEETNEAYAIAKIAGIKMCQAYHAQYGADFISAMPTNLYGPGDNFDLNASHVIPALLRKFHDAHQLGSESVTVWGTGRPRRELNKNMLTGASLKSGVVTIEVTDASPIVAQQIIARMLDQVMRFNESRRLEKAAAEREFTAQQLVETDAALRAAESRLRDFMEENRVRVSPTLQLEQDRLQREVGMRQELYTATAQAYQQVKIEELRNARSISIIEPPEVPPIANPRGLLKAIVLGAFAGFLVGSLLALFREYLQKTRLVRPAEGEEFRELKRALWQDLRSPFRSFRKRKLAT